MELQKERVITPDQIAKIKDEVGTCWLDLGIELQIKPEAGVRNLQQDYSDNRERAVRVLEMWIKQEGEDATVGRLVRALITAGQKGIAAKLLGM